MAIDRLPPTAAEPHDSFRKKERTVRETIDYAKVLLKDDRDDELRLTREAIQLFPNYHDLKQKEERGEQFDLQEAAKLAAIEGAVLYLQDPYCVNSGFQLPPTFRVFRTLELTGALPKENLEGDVLLIGSGVTSHEVQALNARVEILDSESAETHARAMIAKLESKPFDLADMVVGDLDLVLEHAQMAEVTCILPRRSNDVKIVALEPNTQALMLYRRGQRMGLNSLDQCRVECQNTTLGDYLASEPKESFSLVVARRTDPRVWTSGLNDFDYDELSAQIDRLPRREAAMLHYKATSKARKEVGGDVSSVLRTLANSVKVGSQIYISVGTGNTNIDPRETAQRGVFITQVPDIMRGKGMEPVFLSFDERESTGLSRREGDLEIDIVIGAYTQQAMRRFGIKVENEHADSSSTKRRRRRRR